MPAWDQLALAASDTVADSAGPWHGHSNGCVPCDPLSHVAGSISQCSILPLLEIPVNTNNVAVSEQGMCHASKCDRAGVKMSSEAKFRGPFRQHLTHSCGSDNKGLAKLRGCTGRNSPVVCDGSNNISSSSNSVTGQQRSASNQPKDPVGTQALRQLQGRCNRNMPEPNLPSTHGHQASVVHCMSQQGKRQGLGSDTDRNQAANAGLGESTVDKRKALMKAIVRTTPTRAPSLLPEAMQLSGLSAANKPNSMAQCPEAESACSQSTSVLEVRSSQSQKNLTHQPNGVEKLVLPCPALSGLEGKLRSDAPGGLTNAESCKGSVDCISVSDVGVGRGIAGTILGSAERRAVKRSLLSQPDFC